MFSANRILGSDYFLGQNLLNVIIIIRQKGNP